MSPDGSVDDLTFAKVSDGNVNAGMFSSTLAAGVSGGSAPRFIGTTGVTRGNTVGSVTDYDDGIKMGVTTRFVIGTNAVNKLRL